LFRIWGFLAQDNKNKKLFLTHPSRYLSSSDELPYRIASEQDQERRLICFLVAGAFFSARVENKKKSQLFSILFFVLHNIS
jgi:hypothetical protein